MLKNYLKLLESDCRKFKTAHKEVEDVIIYGSSVKGKSAPRDIDIMVLFLKMPLKKRLEITQSLKNRLKEQFDSIDVKSMNVLDFFDTAFLARQGILLEGISLIKNKPLANLLGFRSFMIFTYNLSNLNQTEKIKFNYALNGRNGEGVLQSSKGISLGKGVVQIPMENSGSFEEFLQKWKINFIKKGCLMPYY